MRKLLCFAIALAFAHPVASQAASLALDFELGPNGTTTTPTMDIVGGWQFEVVNQVNVRALGFYDVGADGLAGDHTVAIWQEGNPAAPLAQVTLQETGTAGDESYAFGTPTDLGVWRFLDLDTTLNLAVGTYRIGGSFSAGGTDAAAVFTSFDVNPNLSFNSGAFGVGNGAVYPSILNVALNGGVYGPNFLVNPLPASLLLLLTALGGLGLYGRRLTQT